MIEIFGGAVLIGLAAMASSRSEYWQTVLCRLWIIGSLLWMAIAYQMTARAGEPSWSFIVLPPLGVFLFGAALHWAFSGLRRTE